MVFFIGMLLFQVWKYLNSKALASKTVLDDLAKDCTIILGLALITSWVTWMKIAEEYNYYVAMGIVRSGLALRIGLMAQGMAFSTVRYLFLFHFEDINSVDENTIKLVARVFALILALLCAVFEDFSKNIKFLYLTEINIDKNLVYQSSISTHVMLIISLFVIFFVQGRIVYFKWKHPDPPQNQNVNDQYNLKAISFACFIALIQFSVLIVIAFVETIVIVQLLKILASYVLALMMIMLLIYSNENMSNFVMAQLKTQISFIEPDPEMSPNDNPSNPDDEENQSQEQSSQLPNPFEISQPIRNPGVNVRNEKSVYSISAHLPERSQSHALPHVSV